MSAKWEIEEFIRNWEFSAALANGPGCFRLHYKDARFTELEREPVMYRRLFHPPAAPKPP